MKYDQGEEVTKAKLTKVIFSLKGDFQAWGTSFFVFIQ